MRKQRCDAAESEPRILAQLRRRGPARTQQGYHTVRFRPRHHALRPRKQLRAAIRQRRDNARTTDERRFRAIQRRTLHQHESRIRHVGRTVRQLGVKKISHRKPQPEPEKNEPRICRSLLQPPLRPQHTRRRDTAGYGGHRKARESPLSRHIKMAEERTGDGYRLPRQTRRATAHRAGQAEHARQGTGRERHTETMHRKRHRIHLVLTARARAAH